MEKLSENMINLFGKHGQCWLNDLPMIIDKVAQYWQLSQIVPVANMTYHYVAKATSYLDQPVIIKIGFDSAVTADEKKALDYFNGKGTVKLIDYCSPYNALLLEQAIPGTTLKSLYPMALSSVIENYLDVFNALHENQRTPIQSRHVCDWLVSIDKVPQGKLPNQLVKKAISLKNQMLASPNNQFFLHGDLHHDNILKNEDNWVAIDPKGILGEREFELAAFDFISQFEINNQADLKKIMIERIALVAEKAKLNPQRLKDWVFIRLILAAAWYLEDNGDPSQAILLAESCY